MERARQREIYQQAEDTYQQAEAQCHQRPTECGMQGSVQVGCDGEEDDDDFPLPIRPSLFGAKVSIPVVHFLP